MNKCNKAEEIRGYETYTGDNKIDHFIIPSRKKYWGGGWGPEQLLEGSQKLEMYQISNRHFYYLYYIVSKIPSHRTGPCCASAIQMGQKMVPVLNSPWFSQALKHIHNFNVFKCVAEAELI